MVKGLTKLEKPMQNQFQWHLSCKWSGSGRGGRKGLSPPPWTNNETGKQADSLSLNNNLEEGGPASPMEEMNVKMWKGYSMAGMPGGLPASSSSCAFPLLLLKKKASLPLQDQSKTCLPEEKWLWKTWIPCWSLLPEAALPKTQESGGQAAEGITLLPSPRRAFSFCFLLF